MKLFAKGAQISGHALHPIAIVFPLALLAASVALDAYGLVTRSARFAEAATFSIGAGAIAGIPVAILGLLDWRVYRPGSIARRIGTRHGLLNLGMLACMALARSLRQEHAAALPSVPVLLVSFGAVGFAAWGFALGLSLVEGRQALPRWVPFSSVSR